MILSTGVQPASAGASRGVVPVGFAAMALIGWTGLLVPSLIREVQRSYGQTDAGIGGAYLLSSLLYVTGTMSVGVLAGRVSRRLLLGAGPSLIAAGLLVMAAATAWPMFVAGFLLMALGGGIVDAGMNALMLDLSGGRAALLNRLHVFFALGALSVPLAVGLVLGSGLPWQGLALATVAVAALLAVLVGTRRLPPTHRDAGVIGEAGTPLEGRRRAAVPPGRRGLPVPLVLLSIAIACYVATEYGVSSWLVRYLDEAPIEVATLALSLFWAALAAGRLLASFADERIGSAALAIGSAMVCALAIVAALIAPSLPFAVAAFAVAGLAAGPIYPAIVSVGGTVLPDRSTTVGSVLVSASIVGSLVYPPAMGVVSEIAGLGVAMLGAAAFAVAAGIAVWAAVAGRRTRVTRQAV